MSVWCGTDLTGNVVVLTRGNSGPKKGKEKKGDNTANNRCVLESDPARDSAVM